MSLIEQNMLTSEERKWWCEKIRTDLKKEEEESKKLSKFKAKR